MVTLEGMKEYGYADDATWQPQVAVRCLNAAMEFYDNAGVKQRMHSDLYDQGVYLLAMHYYDNREAMVIGQIRGEVLHGVQSIIHQLSYTALDAVPGFTPITLPPSEEAAP